MFSLNNRGGANLFSCAITHKNKSVPFLIRVIGVLRSECSAAVGERLG